MANEKKITKRDYFNALRNFIEGEDTIDGINCDNVLEFIDKELALLDKKKSSSANSAKKQENEGYKQTILDVLANNEPMCITDIYDASEELSTALNRSNQKMSSLLTQLKNENLVIRSEVKGKAYFTVNPEEVDG